MTQIIRFIMSHSFLPSILDFGYMALGGAERILKEFKVLTEKRVRLMDGVRESESPRSQRVLAEMTTDFHMLKL